MAKRCDLVYGASGAGKTTYAVSLAHAIHKATGKHTRWYLGDGGGATIYETGYVGEFIEVFPYNLRKFPLETTQLISEGYWPDQKSIDNNTFATLLPPSADDLERVGLWVFEGLTVISDYMMGDTEGGMAWRMGRGESLNRDESYVLKDGTMKFGGNARTHYGFVQRRDLDLIQRSRQLPGMVLWTAHERRVDDEETRETLFGPDVCGKALTPRIGASFGNTTHLQVVHTSKQVVDPLTKKKIDSYTSERRAYTREHVDPEAKTFVKYFANTRLPRGIPTDEAMPEYFSPPDPVEFYRRLELAHEKGRKLADAVDVNFNLI
jgi:energy-coupling factor transporter ATP-binding protein EcfA2